MNETLKKAAFVAAATIGGLTASHGAAGAEGAPPTVGPEVSVDVVAPGSEDVALVEGDGVIEGSGTPTTTVGEEVPVEVVEPGSEDVGLVTGGAVQEGPTTTTTAPAPTTTIGEEVPVEVVEPGSEDVGLVTGGAVQENSGQPAPEQPAKDELPETGARSPLKKAVGAVTLLASGIFAVHLGKKHKKLDQEKLANKT